MKDLHVHTTFSDGKNTPEEMILAALDKGLETIGFSDHSPTFFDKSYCISPQNMESYLNTILSLRERYRGRIEVLLGIEQDFYSHTTTVGFDYVIGSVHYLKFGEAYVPVDESPEILLAAAETYCGGDIYTLVEEYYHTVSWITRADIIGHFDLITKFNEGGRLFDESHPRYIAAWKAAADKLLKTGAVFEINTGAISRGYRSAPYPAAPIRDYLRGKGAKLIQSSDSHSCQTLAYRFGEWA